MEYENWDRNPPDEFRVWWARHPEAKACKAVTGWNTDRNRKEFRRWQMGEPEPPDPELSPEAKERASKFLADLFDRKKAAGRFGNVPKAEVVVERTTFKEE